MAIRPIDMHVLLPKLHKNDMLKPHIANKQINEQQLMENVNRQDAQEKMKRVNDFDQKESPRVREDGKRGAGREQSGRNDEQEHEKKKNEDIGIGSKRNHLDIKV